MPLITLVYISFQNHHLSDNDLLELLKKARQFNQMVNITGMLLTRHGNFIQVLEGEIAIVEQLFERISKDERHKHVIVVYRGPIERRNFAGWSMGFSHISDQDLETFPELNTFLSAHTHISQFTFETTYTTHLLEAFRDKL
jgi:hypothetical protein